MEIPPLSITESLFTGAIGALATYIGIRIGKKMSIDAPEYPTPKEKAFMNKFEKWAPFVIGPLIAGANFLGQIMSN